MKEDTATILNATISAFGLCVDRIATTEDQAVRLFCRLHEAITNLTLGRVPDEKRDAPTRALPPGVTIEGSVSDERIVSLIDGRPYQSLRRHLAHHGYTPETYREAFGLPDTYPLVAPAYSRRRAALAKQTGLGTPANRQGVSARKPTKAAA